MAAEGTHQPQVAAEGNGNAQGYAPPWFSERSSPTAALPGHPVYTETSCGSRTRQSSQSSSSPRAHSEPPPDRQDLFGLENLCGACCAPRPKGLKLKRLKAIEYATLLDAMDVDDSVPYERAHLAPFLARFPYKLHALLRPIFFHLGKGGDVDENSIDWATFVENISQITHGTGASWKDLLEAFGNCTTGSTVESSVQNASCLSFYCSHPYLALSPDDALTGTAPPGSSQAGPGFNDSWQRKPSNLDDLLVSTRSPRMERSDSTPHHNSRMSIISMIAALEEPSDDSVVSNMSKSSVSSLSALYDCSSVDAAARWLAASTPCLPRAIGPQLATTLMGKSLSRDFPIITSEILDAGLAFLLRGTSAELWESEPWAPLFCDYRDGKSFVGLLHSVQHYRGPIAMVIRTQAGQVLGALSKYWLDGHGEFTGGPDCFLFSLAPTLSVLRASGASHYAYVNFKNKSKTRGIGFGGKSISGSEHCFRLYVDDCLDQGYVMQSDMTYQRGALLPGAEFKTDFKVACIELWGCGTKGTKENQTASKELVRRVTDPSRAKDKKNLISSTKSANLFLPNTFKATQDSREATDVFSQRKSPPLLRTVSY